MSSAGSSTSNFVYVQSDEYAWVPARLVTSSSSTKKNNKDSRSSSSSTATVSIPTFADEQSICSDGKVRSKATTTTVNLANYPNQALPLQNVNEQGALKEVEDMVDLPFLHEAAILYNLKARHIRSKPYTRTGDIVIAVNPYQWILDLYSKEKRLLYANVLVWDADHEGTDARSTVEPHVYETSSLSYRGLAVEQQNQSILVSGESGAGKTETVKILMNHLASVQSSSSSCDLTNDDGTIQQQQQQGSSTTTSTTSSPIVQRVVDSNPLLEAFGNAKTIRNDNSSRFGKYLQLQFDVEDATHAAFAGKAIPSCILAGSKCEVYLLEKSRVVSHEVEERTYHIFYQLLAASDEIKEEIWDGLVGTDQESFVNVGYSDTNIIEGKTDEERFELTRRALALVGVVDDKFLSLMRAICVVLQLGNLSFDLLEEDVDKSQITSTEELQDLSELMGVEPTLIESSLTQRTVRARSEEYKVPLTVDAAKDSCDALAKEIYSKTFLWLVRQINDATCAEYNYHDGSTSSSSTTTNGGGGGPSTTTRSSTSSTNFGIIGLLDIFGFESFQVNRFEQLCINYANEKLQQKFTQDIFRSVQAEYEYEGIEMGEITYEDNVDVLDLVEGRLGLIALLNEECVRPRGNDVDFVSKIKTMNKDSYSTGVLIVEKSFREYEFAIQHYAGRVTYDATNFVTKNNDALPQDLLACAKQSTNTIIANELEKETMMNEGGKGGSGGSGKVKKKKRPATTKSSSLAANRRMGGSRLVQQTVWTKFRGQLTSLMTSLSTTRTRYIRCIKPNTHKEPYMMMHMSTVEQLRCAGVVAAVTISRSAFPNRLEHEVVLERFKSLWTKGALIEQQRKQQQQLNNSDSYLLDDSEHDATGSSERIKKDVEDLLSHALRPMQTIGNKKNGGKIIRAFVIGRTRAYFRAGALEFLEAERLRGLGRWAVSIQRMVRGYMAKSTYLIQRNAAIRAVAKMRQFITRRRYIKLRRTCIVGQCWIRVKRAKRLLWTKRRNKCATDIQTRWRVYTARVSFFKHRGAVIVIQALARGSMQRPKFRAALHEKQEEAKLENKLKALQRRLEEAEKKRLDAEKKAEEAKAKPPSPPPPPPAAPAPPVAAALPPEIPAQATVTKAETPVQARPIMVEAAAATAMAVAAPTFAEGTTMPATPIHQTHHYPYHMAAAGGIPQSPITPMQLTVQQQHLMDESGKMLEYLRKEVFKLRTQNAQLRTDFDLLKENNQRLMDANASAGASFAALNQHAKQLNKQNQRLQAEIQSYKEQFQRVNLAQVEIKEELKMKQATYIAEVQSRLQYQKTLARIVDTIQDRCRDTRLVEDVLAMSDECDSEQYMSSSGDSGRQTTSSSGGAAAFDPRNSGDASVLSRFGFKSLFG